MDNVEFLIEMLGEWDGREISKMGMTVLLLVSMKWGFVELLVGLKRGFSCWQLLFFFGCIFKLLAAIMFFPSFLSM